MARGKAAPIIIPGTRYGNLVTTGIYVKGYTFDNKKISNKVECKCDCGNITYTKFSHLQNGNTKSCGSSCIYRGHIKHNLSKDEVGKYTKEFKAWCRLRIRCNNPKIDFYELYGGKGITYSKEFETITSFIDNFGYAPSKYHRFIRIDKEGNYEPGNVKWNLRNRRKKK